MLGLRTTKWSIAVMLALAAAAPTGAAPGLAKWGALPLSFEPNRGQTDPAVNFLVRSSEGVQLPRGRCAHRPLRPLRRDRLPAVPAAGLPELCLPDGPGGSDPAGGAGPGAAPRDRQLPHRPGPFALGDRPADVRSRGVPGGAPRVRPPLPRLRAPPRARRGPRALRGSGPPSPRLRGRGLRLVGRPRRSPDLDRGPVAHPPPARRLPGDRRRPQSGGRRVRAEGEAAGGHRAGRTRSLPSRGGGSGARLFGAVRQRRVRQSVRHGRGLHGRGLRRRGHGWFRLPDRRQPAALRLEVRRRGRGGAEAQRGRDRARLLHLLRRERHGRGQWSRDRRERVRGDHRRYDLARPTPGERVPDLAPGRRRRLRARARSERRGDGLLLLPRGLSRQPWPRRRGGPLGFGVRRRQYLVGRLARHHGRGPAHLRRERGRLRHEAGPHGRRDLRHVPGRPPAGPRGRDRRGLPGQRRGHRHHLLGRFRGDGGGLPVPEGRRERRVRHQAQRRRQHDPVLHVLRRTAG